MRDISRLTDNIKKEEVKSIQQYREAAVLILLKKEEDRYNIVFEQRAMSLKSQPGDICLPGGRVDPGETGKEAAIRECCEELGTKYSDINYIGEIDWFLSPYGLKIYVHVAEFTGEGFAPSQSEVDHVLEIPIKYFEETEPLLYNMQIGPLDIGDFPFHLINRGENYNFKRGTLKEYFYKYDNYVIWGFTASIVKHFVDKYVK